MRRPSLKNLAPTWRKIGALTVAFVIGVLFDGVVRTWVAHDIDVWVIRGLKGQGCKGSWGSTKVRFGRGVGQTDGAYDIPCDQFSKASETVQLRCECP